ncbi:hypothetical protein [Burkholderia ambifaria]|uniref:hypothetical protein n=1 Tax=Burkholderia ambifaria TaxID=152480 RepID=UPI00158F2061|nr:hypothetical protein [Burkholderia ambifaria]MDP9587185.1 hypothetical protein [Burkholderia contaminans]
MKNHAAKQHSERPKSSADNVYHLSNHDLNLRHRAIREHLRDQLARHAEESIVAIACVTMQADGTISISAKGIEADLADDMLDGLGHLSARIRHHTKGRSKLGNRQRGYAAVGLMAAIALLGFAYVNEIPWLDCATVLAGQLLAPFSDRKRALRG